MRSKLSYRNLSCLVVAGLLGACQPGQPTHWQGYVEGEYRYLGSTGAGTLTGLAVQRGQQVEAGAALFALDAASETQELARLDAQLAQQQAVLANLQKGQRPDELAVIQAQAEQAGAQLQLSKAQWLRVQGMRAKNLSSQEQVDSARSQLERDEGHARELAARLRVAKLGARSAELDGANAALRALQAQRDQAQWRLQQKQVSAPVAGLIHDTLYQNGEVIAAGKPVVILLPDNARKVRFFVPERLRTQIQLQQSVTIFCDGCPANLHAQIRYIGTEVEYTPPVLFNRDNRSELLFRVDAWPDDGVVLPVGLPVEVSAGAAT